MLAAVSAGLDGLRATVVEAAAPLEDTLERIRSVEAPIVLLLIGADLPKIDRSMLIAAAGPLALELAPDRRIGVLDCTSAGREADVIDAAKFLARAESTTGQVLTIGE